MRIYLENIKMNLGQSLAAVYNHWEPTEVWIYFELWLLVMKMSNELWLSVARVDGFIFHKASACKIGSNLSSGQKAIEGCGWKPIGAEASKNLSL